ncbi:MAG: DUF4340 domain-containing protein [Bryobacteraceae bacterium]|nr:DUF4340 domain-containing protein [Bryobacteraceae bacterium]
MSLRGLLVGAVILAALGGAVWWSETKNKQDDTAKSDKEAPKIVTLKEDEVTRVEIRRREAEPVILQRGKDGWSMTVPTGTGSKSVRPDNESATSLVSSLAGLTSDRVVEEKAADLTSFGLNAPAVQVAVLSKDNKSKVIQIGDETPTAGGYYAKVEGDPRVFSLSSAAKANIDKSWRDLQDKRLITSGETNLSRVELVSGKGQTVEFGRSGQNEWQILKPRPLRADSWQVEELIRKVRDTKLSATATEEEEKTSASEFAIGTRVALVSLTDPSGAQTLEVRSKGQAYYAKSSVVETPTKVEKELADALAKSLDDFRAKKVFEFGFAEPSKVELQDNGKGYHFSKTGDKWWSNGKQMDGTSVQSLIDKLRDLQATKLTDSGSAQPVLLNITVVSAEGKRTEKAAFAKGPASWFGKRENESTTYEIDSKVIEEIQRAAADVKAPPPPSAPSAKK